MQTWKTLDRSTILRVGNGHFLTVENHVVELPNGRIIPDWAWVITPDYVNVVAVTETGHFLCFRQTKYAVEGMTLAIVGGYLEPGEDALTAAQRELLEETGYVAAEWVSLGRYAVDGNRGCGYANLFLAKGVRWVQPIDADDLEEQELLQLTRQEVITALHNGDFKVSSWSQVFALALLKLDGVLP